MLVRFQSDSVGGFSQMVPAARASTTIANPTVLTSACHKEHCKTAFIQVSALSSLFFLLPMPSAFRPMCIPPIAGRSKACWSHTTPFICAHTNHAKPKLATQFLLTSSDTCYCCFPSEKEGRLHRRLGISTRSSVFRPWFSWSEMEPTQCTQLCFRFSPYTPTPAARACW